VSWPYRDTHTGFSWGPARVIRLIQDDRAGVYIMIAGSRQAVEVRVTKGGNLRVGPVQPTPEHFKTLDARGEL
jgi:hypothetical protein